MRVLIFAITGSTILGFRRDFIKLLLEKGHKVDVACPEDQKCLSEKLSLLGVGFIPLRLDRTSINPFGDLRTLFQMIGIISSSRPDVVFSFMSKAIIWGSIAARICSVKNVYAMIEGLGYSFSGKSIKRRILSAVISMLYKVALGGVTCVYVLNPDDGEYLCRHGLASPDKIRRVYGCGLDTDFYAYVPVSDSSKISFLYVGRLLTDKGIRIFIEAANALGKKYPQSKFTIVGGYDKTPASISEREIEELKNNPLIEYAGTVTDVRPFLAGASVVVLPSYYREGLPRSLSEGMSTGRPVIATDSVGARETLFKRNESDSLDGFGILECRNGYLIEPKNVGALILAMEEFILHPEKIEPMGMESRMFAVELMDSKKINGKIVSDMEDFENNA